MASSLLAIVLVISSTRGHHYVFSYPPDPQRKQSHKQSDSTSSENVYGIAWRQQQHQLQQQTEQQHHDSHSQFEGRDSILGIDTGFLADALAPKSPLRDRKFQMTIDDLTFVGHPISLTADDQQQQQQPSQQKKWQSNDDSNGHRRTSKGSNAAVDDSHSSSHITQFHVVFVISPPDLELNNQVDILYDHIIKRYTTALRYEQLRCEYVKREADKVLAIKEEATNHGTPYSQVMLSILAESSLARDIKHIFTSLSSNSIAHVIVNDFIDLSLQLPVVGNQQKLSMMLQYPGATNPVNESVASIYVGAYEYDKYPVLCPYHTLLLLEDPEEVLKSMPLDSNPTLVQLVQILTPTQNLQELHLLLDCSLAQIYRLAAHLIYWRKAKLIHPIHARNVYAISPVAKMENFKELEADFKSHVPGLDLPTLLSELSSTRPLYMITPSKELRQQYCVAIMYLLRFDLVIQLHMYLVLLPIPKEVSPTSDDQLGSSPTDDWLKRFASDKAPREVADLFQRLVPYLNGRHPMDEIVFREGITRKQLSLVLKYYADYIVTLYHYAN
ncbi:hypothetical protein INT44_007812 [Umbelopsis vinacea]|uniref:Nitrogen permease regulator 3 n=1 Tax=Umbelopsis vinacea TaxID=44442 RepID=A0A8H7PKV4_9FUNG|nr:hypothetical protein INT44_007812 [Umbelopsis vinacea]